MSELKRGRRSYRTDPRPRIAQACKDYASMWSVWVQWDVQRRHLIASGVDTAGLDAYFDGQLSILLEQLTEAIRLTAAPNASQHAGDGDPQTPSTLDKG